MDRFKNTIVSVCASLAIMNSAYAGTLIINSGESDPMPKKAWEEVIKKFEIENPDITVKYNLYDHESYKTAIRNWLVTSPPDVVFWFAGNRMKTFVDRGLFEDVTDLWQQENLVPDFASTQAAMSVNGKIYGVPYTYYQWGIYYRRDIFDQYNLSEPTNWEEFIKVADTLKSNGVTPFTIGTKYLWTAAGWFDYLNLRVNGLQYHIDLMDGKIPYTDNGVRETFQYWKTLIDKGYFVNNHATYSWQEAQAFIYNGDAAMYLIGNFFAANFTDDIAKKMDFFQFPNIKSSIPMAEDAPMNTLHIPSKAKNKQDAKQFLKFVARADTQTFINGYLSQIPTNNKAIAKDDPFLNEGIKVLNEASGTAQFYDRDTDPAMAKEGMKGFQEFMVYPERLDKILSHLEKTRQRIFKP
ncbi:extracellular solute-binding protein [Vibrio sp. DW001]|uniref:ABC transporter substrate-binding protein n=1 Tax=Vibrio sp. DW001 TaxID=2912315 RepID=UPI0023AFEED7|nr:extracellular solute-binding protein [Vibrio sp. DW001]WED28851.1 extracellular solute-binding protein [Vibrio sp. DW001]